MEIGQRLYDATKAYQRWAKRYHKAGGGNANPEIRREWFLAVRDLHYAAEDAWRSVQSYLDENPS